MRIALDGSSLLGPRTGVGWHTAELLDAMADLAPNDQFDVFPISWRTARRLELASHPNVAVVRRFAPARPLRELWDRVPFPPLEWFIRADVFHATNFLAPPTRRMPTVVTVHDVGFVRFPELVGPRERELTRLAPRSLRRAAAIIAVSEFTRRELLEWLPDLAGKVVVIPNGAHGRALPAHPGSPERPFALMLGSLNPRKNIPLVLDALAELRRRDVDLGLVLAGEPAPGLDVHRLIVDRNLDECVSVTGYVNDEAVGQLLATAAVLAFPSLYEGFGMPLLEAMEAGIPIVATAAGATPETVDGAGILVENDADAFADGLTQAVFEEPTRRRLIEMGRRRAAAFSWADAARRTLELYRTAVG
jgi:glycosyltransferase involved in cell wall biosynthesis